MTIKLYQLPFYPMCFVFKFCIWKPKTKIYNHLNENINYHTNIFYNLKIYRNHFYSKIFTTKTLTESYKLTKLKFKIYLILRTRKRQNKLFISLFP